MKQRAWPHARAVVADLAPAMLIIAGISFLVHVLVGCATPTSRSASASPEEPHFQHVLPDQLFGAPMRYDDIAAHAGRYRL